MPVQIQQRRDTAANWAAVNPVLALGEVGWETDTRLCKLGDGSTTWNSLAYTVGGVSDFIDLGDVPISYAGQGAKLVAVKATEDGLEFIAAGGGGVSDGDKGDVTVSGGGATWTIDAGAVTYAKMQDVSATQRVIGRNTSGAGDPEEVTFSQILDWVGSAANGDILYRSGGAWTRLPVGTNGQVLTVASNLPSWGAGGGGGGLTNWTEAVSTASPNATVPVVSFTATNAATNVDMALMPKGTGGLAMAIADGTTTGGNKRGARSVDLQRTRTAATQVVSGTDSFAVGAENTVNGTAACALGSSNTASNSASAAIGQSNTCSGFASIVAGQNNNASGSYCAVFGFSNVADAQGCMVFGRNGTNRGIEGALVQSNGVFSSNRGEAQSMRLGLRVETTNATPTVVTTNGSGAGANNQITLPNSSVYAVKAIVAARQNSTGDCAMFELTFLVKRNANAASTAIVGTPTVTQVFADAGASTWAVSVTANTTTGCAAITVTGEAAKTIRWMVDMYACAQLAF